LADFAVTMQTNRLKNEYEKKKDLVSDAKMITFTRKLFIRLSRLFRGPKAQERISVFVLAEFISSLILVAASAILFWALTLKAVFPAILSLSSCFQLSLSYFLPGVGTAYTSASIPLWIKVGAAATAWVLLVLYVGPASSLLPDRQRATINGLSESYRLYRRVIVSLGRERSNHRLLSKTLP